MELFKYIVKFLYRIRWWMVILPCIAGIIAWFLTRNLEKTYDVKTTIFTGIISGYNVDATDTRNAGVHLSNLMNIITTERTLKIVSLKLLARCLVYGDAERNTSYISAIHYQQLVGGVPRELQALIDKQNEEKTYDNLVAFERPSINNFIYQLLNYTHPYFSVPLLSQNIKVGRLGTSDMIEIAYSANDPGIAYNTLEILNEEFVKQYHDLRYGETDNVIKFFQEELARLGKMLTAAEDSLIDYNIEHRIINYEEQTKQVAGMDANYQMMDNDLLINYSTSKALIDFYEYKLGDVAKLIRTNNEFMNKLQQMSKLNTQISTMEITPDENNQKKLEEQKGMLSNAEESISELALQLSAEAASTNNVSYETLINQWLEQIVLAERTKAQMEARDIMREKLNQDFLYFSPIGATLGRKERHIGFVESNYMSTMGALNAAILRQKNLEMTSASLKIMNPPLFPLTSSPTNARMIILSSMLGTLLFIIGYFLIIEILDRTLRDKIRAERITGGKVIGAYPKESKLRYRRYNKAIDEMATKQLSSSLLPYLNANKQRVINLLSTEEKDGKTHIAQILELYWSSIGLNVRRITYDEDFLSEDSQYVQASNLKDLCPDLEPDEIVIMEYPVLKSNPLPPALLNEASVNLMIVRANRTWKNTDQAMYERLLKRKLKEVPFLFYLTQADRNAVEDFTGQLPPYTNFKNLEYRLFQLGLTAVEYKRK
ncbi:GumC family protein [Phocaeicola sp.]